MLNLEINPEKYEYPCQVEDFGSTTRNHTSWATLSLHPPFFKIEFLFLDFLNGPKLIEVV